MSARGNVPPLLVHYLVDEPIGHFRPREVQHADFEGPPLLDLNPEAPGAAVYPLLSVRQARELRDVLDRWIESIDEEAQTGEAAARRWEARGAMARW